MVVEGFFFKGKDGKRIYAKRWLNKDRSKTRAVLQISHGMAEHIERYDDFARYMVQQGFAVYGNDHRGHGKTIGKNGIEGYFGEKDGWNLVLSDLLSLQERIREDYNDLPVFLLGHSMGSLLAREYAQRYGENLHGLILSGTLAPPGIDVYMGLIAARIEGLIKGKKRKSPFLHKMSFGGFNKKFQPSDTEHDWLSSDPWEVEAYENDPLSGNVFTAGFYQDLLRSVIRVNKQENHERTPKELPIYLFSGEHDPVGKETKGVELIKEKYLKSGNTLVETRYYPKGRHEMLHESNKEAVYQDVVNWMTNHL